MIHILDDVEMWSCPYEECGALCCEGSRELTHLDVRRVVNATGRDWEEFAYFDAEEKIFKMRTGEADRCRSQASSTQEGPVQAPAPQERCVFLTGLECSIHDERYEGDRPSGKAEPIVCRILPFRVSRISYGDEPILYLSSLEECPGYGEGEEIDEEFRARVEELAGRFLQEQHEMLKLLRAGKTPGEIVEAAA